MAKSISMLNFLSKILLKAYIINIIKHNIYQKLIIGIYIFCAVSKNKLGKMLFEYIFPIAAIAEGIGTYPVILKSVINDCATYNSGSDSIMRSTSLI